MFYSTWSTVNLKRVWDVNIKKWRRCLFNLRNLITHMAYLCSQRAPKVQLKYFLFHWSIYRLFVLNWVWKSNSFQMRYIRTCLPNIKHGSTKNAFFDVNNKKWRVWYMFHAPFLSNKFYGLPVLTKGKNFPNQVFYVSLDDLQTICAK
jgi:hypothetical protein